jgi:hypothetical protein
MDDFNWKTKLDALPDSYKLSQKDFDSADKLIEKHFFTAPVPRGTRVTTPANFEFEMLFIGLIAVARLIKGDTQRVVTVGQCREYQRREAQGRQQS